MTALNILHIFRAPIGGLFRHVLDLTHEQIARGHRVGLIADSSTGGALANDVLKKIEPLLALGLTRIPIRRHAGPGDAWVLAHVMRRSAQTRADVLHGHGAKGGAYARMVFNNSRAVGAYTPHGGSLLFAHDTVAGKFYLTTEKLLMPRGDLFLFESAYSADVFRRKIGTPSGLVRIVHNGVSRQDFEAVVPQPDASDLVFMGELRRVKGVDLLIDAIALLHRDGRSVTATLIGDGPEREALRAQVDRLRLPASIRFMPAMSARQALTFGRIMAVPSRAESLPYVVLEAAAAGMPLIATNVGGIPEIYGPLSDGLVPPENAGAFARAIVWALDRPGESCDVTRRLRERVAASFSVDRMVDGVLTAYHDAIEMLRENGRR